MHTIKSSSDPDRTKTKRIVLTGGPGGGKTTAADLVRRELGEDVVIVPETATILFSGGFPRVEEKEAKKAAQRAIYHVQKNMEYVQKCVYPGRVLLCDRGTLDGTAYWPTGENDFFERMGTTIEDELSRYDAVVFFETAAVGNISIEGGNPTRTENIEKAIELDRSLKSIWSKHPNFIHVPHQKSFLTKLQIATDALQGIIQKVVH